MRMRLFAAGLLLSAILSACGAFEGAGDVAKGRRALFAGNDEAALAYFRSAEKAQPNYEIDLAMISASAIDWGRLVADGESLGKRIEQEPDLALEQEEHQQSTDSGM